MIIPITNDYRITADEYQWILQKLSGTRKNRKTGELEPNWKDKGYYNSLEHLANDLCTRMVRTSSASTIAELEQEYKNAVALLTHALAPQFHITDRAQCRGAK
jgi:hypothetical protein